MRRWSAPPDFLYVADAKLCSSEAMGHIAAHGGRFVTIVPHGRREDTWFRDWAQTHAPVWTEADRRPGAREGDPERIWRTFEAPAPSVDGYRVIWVHSSGQGRPRRRSPRRPHRGRARRDRRGRRPACPAPRPGCRTRVAAEQAATTALTAAGATRWVGFTRSPKSTEVAYRQERRGRPGTSTRYRRSEKPVFTITAAVNAETVAYDAVTDGCFPLITNDRQMTPAEVLAAYRYQPNLERRNHILKGPQQVAPVCLETAHRIEALLLCHFLAMLTEALIEREIRTAMKAAGLTGIPLYPELRNCTAPSADRILEIFTDIQRHHLIHDDTIVQTFEPELTPLQQQVLDLLHVPTSVYTADRRTPEVGAPYRQREVRNVRCAQVRAAFEDPLPARTSRPLQLDGQRPAGRWGAAGLHRHLEAGRIPGRRPLPDVADHWVTLDRGDTEPVRLWSHLIAALARSDPTVGARSLAALRASPGRVIDAVLPVLFDELTEGDRNVVIILDDYHLAENPDVNAQVEAFLRYRPARVQLVVASRSDPALGVPRLRACGELVEVRADSLRFQVSELAGFFEGMRVTGLTDAEALRLAERTGGWPAPLRLAALLIPEHDRDAFIDSFTGGTRQVVDYLTGDVLDLVDPAKKEFLLQVCVLDRMNGPLCDAVIATSGSGQVLADLERANLFVSVDAAGQWYQQHQLFAEALRLELVRTRPELVPVLHGRAAAWFAGIGDLETATDHAIAARDLPLASQLVAAQLQPMVSIGRSATVRRWLSTLSWPQAQLDPELALVRATAACLDNNIEQALQHLQVARTGPADLLDAAGLALGLRADLLEAVFGAMDIGRAEQAARRALAAAPSPVYEGSALAGLGQALYLKGLTRQAVAPLGQAVGQIPDANPLLLAVAVGNLALAESALATSTSRADPMLDHVLVLLSRIGADRTPAGAIIHLARGERDRRGRRSAVGGGDVPADDRDSAGQPTKRLACQRLPAAGGGSSTARRTDAGRDRPRSRGRDPQPAARPREPGGPIGAPARAHGQAATSRFGIW